MADQEWQKRLNDSGYKNWLKVSLALIESKEALHDFVGNVIKDVHNRIKTKLGPTVCTKTSACNTNRGAPSCPSCSQWVKEIKAINGGMLNWKNADPHDWHNKPWEIAKCFMNAQGSKATAAANTGPDKTDLSGILNVLVNCKEFKSHLKEKKLPEHVRTVRNELMHCATMSFNDAEMQTKVDAIIALLEDEKELKNLPSCQKKVEVIKLLRDSKFQMKPEDEDACIDAALKSPELSVEVGEEIDKGTRQLLDKLHELIKENKDLEKKFDVKINKIDKKLKNLKEETDARFLSCDVNFGSLKGTVESLVSRVEKLEIGHSSSPHKSVLAHHEKSLFKNALQSYTQKKKLELPKYDHTRDMNDMYLGMVLVQGQKFESKEPKATKKEAEQSVAEVALTYLGNMDSEDDNDLNRSPSTAHHPLASKSTPQQSKSFKNLLQERAQMHRIPNPIYDDEKVESGFLCKVMYDGRWYSPEMTPQSRKIDAQQKAAQFVLAVLDRDEESSCKNEGSSSDAETSIQGGPTITTSNRSLLAVDKTDGKTSKSLLHEYAQKRGAKPPEYDEIPGSEKGFRSMVKIMGKTFECVEPCSSKKNSREMAAKEAMRYFNELSAENSSKTSTDISAAAAIDCGKIESENASSLAKVKENLIDCEVPSSTSLPISSATNKAYVFTSATSTEKSLAEAVKPSETKVSDSTDEKQTPTLTQKTQPNFKNALQEYVQKRKLDQRYVSIQDPTTKDFLSKVFLGKRCFKGKQRKAKMREAEKHVAEIAMNILEGRSSNADGNCEELLKSYHKELNLPLFPKYEDATSNDDGRFSVRVKVLKKKKIVCKDVKPTKKKVELWLAEQAVKDLEEENKTIPAHENAKSGLNLFLQSQGNHSKLKYEVQGDQVAGFSGCLSFYVVDVFESLAPQPSEEKAYTSCAMSACNGLDLV